MGIITKGRMVEMEPQVLECTEIPGGNRKLIAAQCGEYLVIDCQWGEIKVLDSFDTEREAREDFKFKSRVAASLYIRKVANHAIA